MFTPKTQGVAIIMSSSVPNQTLVIHIMPNGLVVTK